MKSALRKRPLDRVVEDLEKQWSMTCDQWECGQWAVAAERLSYMFEFLMEEHVRLMKPKRRGRPPKKVLNVLANRNAPKKSVGRPRVHSEKDDSTIVSLVDKYRMLMASEGSRHRRVTDKAIIERITDDMGKDRSSPLYRRRTVAASLYKRYSHLKNKSKNLR